MESAQTERSIPSRIARAACSLALKIAVSLALIAALAASPGRAAPPSAESGVVQGEKSVNAETVVLLHGLGRSAANMLILKWRLQRQGYRVCNIGYDTRVDSIELAADAVFEALPSCDSGDGSMHFVTHSLGGLVLRSLLERRSWETTGRLVMLAPPNRGSEIADWLRRFGWADGLMGPLARQLGTREQDLPGRLPPPPLPFGVIAGDRWINPVGPWLLPGPHDGTVSVESTRLESMADHLVLPVTHTFIMNSAEVAQQIEVFLRTGRFRRSSDASL